MRSTRVSVPLARSERLAGEAQAASLSGAWRRGPPGASGGRLEPGGGPAGREVAVPSAEMLSAPDAPMLPVSPWQPVKEQESGRGMAAMNALRAEISARR